MFLDESHKYVRQVVMDAMAKPLVFTEDSDHKGLCEARYAEVVAALQGLLKGHTYSIRAAARLVLKKIPDGYEAPRSFIMYMRAHYCAE